MVQQTYGAASRLPNAYPHAASKDATCIVAGSTVGLTFTEVGWIAGAALKGTEDLPRTEIRGRYTRLSE